MKKKLLILATVLFLTGCSINIMDNVKTEMVDGAYINLNEILVYTDPKLENIIKDTNVEILNKDTSINTDTIGENVQIVEYRYEHKKYKYKMKYEVKDNIDPIILSARTESYIKVDTEEYNPCDTVNMADNYTKVPTCEIIGDYNLSKIGNYKVKYQIKDESNNIAERDLTIHVVKELPEPVEPKPSEPTITYFEDVVNKYKKDNTEIGLDISRWQGDVDFNKVKNAGVTFVMMRIGVSNDVGEELSMDSKYKQNIERAKEAGLKVGVYVYTTAINEDMAKEAANFVIDCLDGVKLDFPIVFDWENWSKFRKYEISIHDLNNTFIAFDKELQKHNLSAMLYSSKYYLNVMWEDRVKNNYQVWLAHYTDNKMTDYDGKFNMWQMCSDGRIDGINGDVDIDVLFK